MSAKKAAKSAIPNVIQLTEQEMGWAEVRAIFKKREQMKKKEEINSKLPLIIEFAGKTFGREFKSLQSLVNFVAKKNSKKGKKSKRATALTDEQKVKIKKLRGEGKSFKEICKEVGCTNGQISKTMAS